MRDHFLTQTRESWSVLVEYCCDISAITFWPSEVPLIVLAASHLPNFPNPLQSPSRLHPKGHSVDRGLGFHGSCGSLPREARVQAVPRTKESPVHSYKTVEISNVWGTTSRTEALFALKVKRYDCVCVLQSTLLLLFSRDASVSFKEVHKCIYSIYFERGGGCRWVVHVWYVMSIFSWRN